jgi:hypothetical protein
MNAAAVAPSPRTEAPTSAWELYKGWFLGLLLIILVLAVGAGFWLHFHP